MNIKFAAFDKWKNEFINGFFTPADLAASRRFPSNANECYEFVLVSGLVDEGDLPIIDGDILEWNGCKFTAIFSGRKWVGLPDPDNEIDGYLDADNFDEAFLIGNKRTDKVFIRGEI